jgi:hypothetical protein
VVKRSHVNALSLVIASGIFLIDFILCEGSSDTAEGHTEQRGYGYKHLLIGLALAVISVWLIKYGVTPGTSSSGGGNTEVVPSTNIELYRPELRTARDCLKVFGDSLDNDK